jgi:hypothetical protein
MYSPCLSLGRVLTNCSRPVSRSWPTLTHTLLQMTILRIESVHYCRKTQKQTATCEFLETKYTTRYQC